jgi:hypothetical protein
MSSDLSSAPSCAVRAAKQLSDLLGRVVISRFRCWQLTLMRGLELVLWPRVGTIHVVFLVMMGGVLRTAIMIGTRTGALILKQLHQTVEAHCEYSTEDGANPVDPVVTIKCAQGDIGTKGAGRVERSSGVEDTCRH